MTTFTCTSNNVNNCNDAITRKTITSNNWPTIDVICRFVDNVLVRPIDTWSLSRENCPNWNSYSLALSIHLRTTNNNNSQARTVQHFQVTVVHRCSNRRRSSMNMVSVPIDHRSRAHHHLHFHAETMKTNFDLRIGWRIWISTFRAEGCHDGYSDQTTPIGRRDKTTHLDIDQRIRSKRPVVVIIIVIVIHFWFIDDQIGVCRQESLHLFNLLRSSAMGVKRLNLVFLLVHGDVDEHSLLPLFAYFLLLRVLCSDEQEECRLVTLLTIYCPSLSKLSSWFISKRWLFFTVYRWLTCENISRKETQSSRWTSPGSFVDNKNRFSLEFNSFDIRPVRIS